VTNGEVGRFGVLEIPVFARRFEGAALLDDGFRVRVTKG